MAHSDEQPNSDLKKEQRIAYVLKQFPTLSETFVLHELCALQNCEQLEIHIVSQRENTESIVHSAARALIASTFYLPRLSALQRLLSQLLFALRFPFRTFRSWQFCKQHADALLRSAFGDALATAPYLRRQGIQHLHTHFTVEASELALFLSFLLEVPFSFTTHARDLYVRKRFLEEKIQHAAFIVTVCEYNRNIIDQTVPGAAAKTLILRPAIDPIYLQEKKPEPAVTHDRNLFQWLAIGRLVEKKGMRYAIEAISILKQNGTPASLRIIGDGPEEAALRAQCHDLQLDNEIQFEGAHDVEGIRHFLASADGFVLPCIPLESGDADATPTVLAEAMASRLPVVSSAITGIPEIVPTTAGRLLPPGDPQALAHAMAMIQALPPAQREAMGEAGHAFVREQWDATTHAKKLSKAFQQAALQRGKASP